VFHVEHFDRLLPTGDDQSRFGGRHEQLGSRFHQQGEQAGAMLRIQLGRQIVDPGEGEAAVADTGSGLAVPLRDPAARSS